MGKNAIINGSCQVAQRSAPTITAGYQYGQVDRLACMADGTPTAGTIAQAATTLLGSTGYASNISGLTTGAGGVAHWRYRIESRDCQRFIDQAAVYSAKVYHNVGSNINYTITINIASAQDNFAAVTEKAKLSDVSVSTATETTLIFSVDDIGSCGNGIEIVVDATCGAVTTKDFYITEF